MDRGEPPPLKLVPRDDVEPPKAPPFSVYGAQKRKRLPSDKAEDADMVPVLAATTDERRLCTCGCSLQQTAAHLNYHKERVHMGGLPLTRADYQKQVNERIPNRCGCISCGLWVLTNRDGVVFISGCLKTISQSGWDAGHRLCVECHNCRLTINMAYLRSLPEVPLNYGKETLIDDIVGQLNQREQLDVADTASYQAEQSASASSAGVWAEEAIRHGYQPPPPGREVPDVPAPPPPPQEAELSKAGRTELARRYKIAIAAAETPEQVTRLEKAFKAGIFPCADGSIALGGEKGVIGKEFLLPKDEDFSEDVNPDTSRYRVLKSARMTTEGTSSKASAPTSSPVTLKAAAPLSSKVTLQPAASSASSVTRTPMPPPPPPSKR